MESKAVKPQIYVLGSEYAVVSLSTVWEQCIQTVNCSGVHVRLSLAAFGSIQNLGVGRELAYAGRVSGNSDLRLNEESTECERWIHFRRHGQVEVRHIYHEFP